MKKILLFILLFGFQLNLLAISSVQLQSRNGVNYIKHEISKGETIFQLAKDYSLRPNILSQFNSLPYSANLSSLASIDIPLTETNFFKFASLDESGGFIKVLYKLESEMSMNEVTKKFTVSTEAFKRWNKNVDEAIFEVGDEVVVGWLKYAKYTNPIVKNTVNENKSISSNEKAQPSDINTNDSKPVVKDKKSKIVPANEYHRTLAEDTKDALVKIKSAFVSKKATNSTSKSETKVNKEVKKTTIANEKTIAKKEVTVKKETKPVGQQLKNKWNDLVAKKEKSDNVKTSNKESIKEKSSEEKVSEELANNNKNNVTQEVVANEKPIVNQEVSKSNKSLKIKEKSSVNKSKVNEKIVEANNTIELNRENEVRTIIDEPVVEMINKSDARVLNFTNSKSGKAEYFYGGPAGAKFYIVTNLAEKGKIVKITNIANNKSIMAEVLNTLSAADDAKGLLLKISDNAKLPLHQKDAKFNVKINY